MFTVIFLQYLAVFFVWLVFFFVQIFVPATTIARTTCRRLASSILFISLLSFLGELGTSARYVGQQRTEEEHANNGLKN